MADDVTILIILMLHNPKDICFDHRNKDWCTLVKHLYEVRIWLIDLFKGIANILFKYSLLS